MDETQQLQRLGWEWRQDGVGAGTGPGVIVKAQVSGRLLQVFIPLSRVWLIFDEELQRVGCPGSASVGAPFSVGGFFSFIKKAASSVAKGIKKIVPKAVQRAASRVVQVARKYGGKAIDVTKTVIRSPILRGAVIAASFAVPALAPAAAALEIANRAADYYDKGVAAAKQIKAGLKNPAQLAHALSAVQQGMAVRDGMGGILQKAAGGDQRAQQVVGAMRQRLVQGARQSPQGRQALQHAHSALANTLHRRPGLMQALQQRHGLASAAPRPRMGFAQFAQQRFMQARG